MSIAEVAKGDKSVINPVLLEIDPNALDRISEAAGTIMHDLQNVI